MSEVKTYVVDCNLLSSGQEVTRDVDVVVVLLSDYNELYTSWGAVKQNLIKTDKVVLKLQEELEMWRGSRVDILRQRLTSSMERESSLLVKVTTAEQREGELEALLHEVTDKCNIGFNMRERLIAALK